MSHPFAYLPGLGLFTQEHAGADQYQWALLYSRLAKPVHTSASMHAASQMWLPQQRAITAPTTSCRRQWAVSDEASKIITSWNHRPGLTSDTPALNTRRARNLASPSDGESHGVTEVMTQAERRTLTIEHEASDAVTAGQQSKDGAGEAGGCTMTRWAEASLCATVRRANMFPRSGRMRALEQTPPPPASTVAADSGRDDGDGRRPFLQASQPGASKGSTSLRSPAPLA